MLAVYAAGLNFSRGWLCVSATACGSAIPVNAQYDVPNCIHFTEHSHVLSTVFCILSGFLGLNACLAAEFSGSWAVRS
jgi:hypothetical protein